MELEEQTKILNIINDALKNEGYCISTDHITLTSGNTVTITIISNKHFTQGNWN